MEIRDYWQVLTKRWWVFVICVLVAAGAAYGFSKTQQPIFRSSAKIYVTPARPDLGLTLVIKDIIRQYSQQMISDKFLNEVNQSLRLDRNIGDLRKMVIAAGTADNLAIQIDVDDADAGVAQRTAKALASAFIQNHRIDMSAVEPRDRIDLKMFDEPQPGVLNRPKTSVNVLAGAVFGIILGAIIAFLLEYTDDTIKTVDDVERHIGLPAIGSIPWLNSGQARQAASAEEGLFTRIKAMRR